MITKDQWSMYKREFGLGALEGLAVGGVFAICTAGISLIALPLLFGFIRGCDRANKMRNIEKELPEMGGNKLLWPEINYKNRAFNLAVGFALAGFTLGLSIPIGAAIGPLE